MFFGLLAGAGYYIWINYSKTPNENTQKLVKSIYKYPTATSWQIEPSKNLCLSPKGCSQPIKILFEIPGAWGELYTYYKTYFANLGWTTNTAVVTSIPTSVVYKKEQCEVVMQNHGDIKYSFTAVCSK